jgi:hypothetical protein
LIALLTSIAFVFGTLVALSLAGGFLLYPFRKAYAVYLAPTAGLSCQAIGIGGLYLVGGLSFQLSATLTFAFTSVLTITADVLRPRPIRIYGELLAAMLCASVLLTPIGVGTTVLSGSPSIADLGTDAFNYAQAADWVRTHKARDLSIRMPESKARTLLIHETRFGAFSFLATIATFRQEPQSLFAFQLAATTALIAALLGAAGSFAYSPVSFVFLALTLVMSHWFDFGHTGFFGKLLAYPTALALAGLVLRERPTTLKVTSITFLSCATSVLHSGYAAALILATALLPYALIAARHRQALPIAATCALTVFLPIASLGALTHWVSPYQFPDWNVGWAYAIPRVLDLEQQGMNATGLSSSGLWALVAIQVALTIAALSLCWRVRAAPSTALLAGPIILLFGLYLADKHAVAFQLLGVVYPMILVGTVLLGERVPLFAGSLAVLMAIIHLPHAYSAMREFTTGPAAVIFTRAAFDNISGFSRRDPLLIDTTVPQAAYAMRYIVEAAPSSADHALCWTKASWQLSGAPGPMPSCERHPLRFCLRHVHDRPSKDSPIWASSSLIIVPCEPAAQ